MPKAADLLTVAPKYIGTPYSKMDCQAFVERCLADIGIHDNLPGSNAWYRRMTWTGTPEECKASFGAIPPGAFLYILKQDGNEPEKYKADGIGNASHIGIYTGMTGAEMCRQSGIAGAEKYNFGDGAINSSSTHASVCTSKFAGKAIRNGWNRVGLWDRLSYEIEFPGGGTYTGDDFMTATVWAGSGATVNLRSSPSRSAALVDQVPVGDTVNVYEQAGEWFWVSWHGKPGYMMAEFLIFDGKQPDQGDKDNDSITVSRSALMAVYDQIGAILGVKK